MKIDQNKYDIEILNPDGSGRWDALDDVLSIEYDIQTMYVDGCISRMVSGIVYIVCIIDGRIATLSLDTDKVNFVKRC